VDAPDEDGAEGYAGFDATAPLEKALRSGGNAIAVHVRGDGSDRFLDLGLLAGAAPAR
jgi:hypothetical protein